jgi:hypothetical protein
MRRFFTVCMSLAVAALMGASALHAQGVTSSVLNGTVLDANGVPLAGASVIAVHEPSATRYGAVTRADGRFIIPGMRVGGPYRVTVSLIGYADQAQEGITLNLGVATDLSFRLTTQAIGMEGITVTATRDAIMSSERTGAATAVDRQALEVMPTISRRLDSFARLTPQYSSGFSFAGQDNRLNNISVDGSYFNNSFGLGGQPGDRTGVAPISLDAIEQVQINVAPYDVRQGNFVGAGVNTVTRSGTNEFRGSLYHQFRNDGDLAGLKYVGRKAGDADVSIGTFDYKQWGGWLSGPIVKDRLFFFASYESDALTEPGTTFRANNGGETVGGSVTRVLKSDLDGLSTFLKQNFDYETGPYQGYDHETPAARILAKLDYNLSDRNKFSLRYTHLDSDTDILASNSSSLGFGNRRTSTQALNFQNTNYQIMENIRSVVGEWNSLIGDNKANSLIIGYTSHDESRNSRGTFFPMVDVLSGGSTYTSFGFEPFTPNNELRYKSFQVQNNFQVFKRNHSLTFGVSAERYESENIFFPGSQSAYVYNSLQDFYTDANDYRANPNRTTSPVTLRRFQVRWSNIPGQEKPIQPLEVFYAGVYAQDEWQVNPDLKVTVGARMDIPFFGDTGFKNAEVDGMSFRDEFGNTVKYSTSKLPDANPLFSPRVGVNWDVFGDKTTQLRGGTGIFTGRPAYVWISNQIGNNGVLTGFEQLDNTRNRPFHPDPNKYKPTSVSGAPASAYELALTTPDFRFPQIWRTNFAVDQKLPLGLFGTLEYLYSKDVNGVYYINANLAPANTSFAGADTRARWTVSNRINSKISSAVVLKNQNDGYSWNLAASLERPFDNGLFVKAAYSYGEAKNTVDPGSIAFGSWNNNHHAGNPNLPGLGYSVNSPGHRLFGALSYRAELFGFGATTFSLFAERRTWGSASYTFAGDANGDGGTSNDLIYIPRDVSEMNFQQYTAGGRTYTAAEQAAAWEAFIKQDKYLSANRGKYMERGAVFMPMVNRVDFSLAQELFTNLHGRRNSLELRADFLNFMNFLNSDWGVGQRFTTTQPLVSPSADAQGRLQYRLRTVTSGGDVIKTTYEPSAGLGDVYRIQISLRYRFN